MKIRFFDISVIALIILVTIATCLLAFELLKRPTGERNECNFNNALTQVTDGTSENNKKPHDSYLFSDIRKTNCSKPE